MFERVDNSVANSSFVLVSAHTSNKIAVYKDIFSLKYINIML